jgi:phage baseplate assembly protein W
MIPNISILTEEITETTRPNKTYKVIFDKNRISGYTDSLDSIAQSVDLILSTERYKHIIYSWDYGVELYDLIGKPVPYVMSELPRRITEALTQDNRIDDVVDFEFEKNGKKLNVKFTVITSLGNIPTALEVEI